MSYDPTAPTEPLSITAAAASLLLSEIPLVRAVAGMRVGRLPDGALILNPTEDEMAVSDLDLMLAGTSEAVLMIEGFGDEISEEEMVRAVALGQEAIARVCEQLETWAAAVGKGKREVSDDVRPEVVKHVTKLSEAKLKDVLRLQLKKKERGAKCEEIRQEGIRAILSSSGEGEGGRGGLLSGDDVPVEESEILVAYKKVESQCMRDLVLEEGCRADGRRVDEVRLITLIHTL